MSDFFYIRPGTSAGGAGSTSGSNDGSGVGVFESVNGSILVFKTITVSGSTLAISSGADGQTVNISSSAIGLGSNLTSSIYSFPSSSFTSASFGITGSVSGGFALYSGKALDGIQQPLLQNALQTYRIPAYDPGYQPFEWRPPTAGVTFPAANGATFVFLGGLTASAVTTGSFLATIPSMYGSSSNAAAGYVDIFSGIGNNGIGIACAGANPGEGGIYIAYKFSVPIDPAASSLFVGLGGVTPGGTATPVSRSHHIGLSYETTDSATGPYYLSHCAAAGTQTRIALSASTPGVRADLLRSSSSYGEQVIILELLNPPGSGTFWNVRVRTQQSASVYTEIYNGMITSSIPAPGYGLVTETYVRGNNGAMRYYGIKGAYGGGFLI